MSLYRIAVGISSVLISIAALPVMQCARSKTTTTATRPAVSTQPVACRKRPTPPAANKWIDHRNRMVETQIAHPRDGRPPVTDPAVLEAMRLTPRHAFIPDGQQRSAYADRPLRIGQGQTISQPYIVAYMTELLKLTPESKVLEVGTGSGYQAAVLAHLTPHVYTIEIIKPLAERAKQTFEAQGYTEIKTRRADGYKGWPEEAPFDAIILTFAADHLPEPLWEQLKPGGRIVIPLGKPYSAQYLTVINKTLQGEKKMKTIMGVRFVPMLRDE